MSEPVHLQFTQEDRDMLRDTNKDVKDILKFQERHSDEDTERFSDHGKRITDLESWKIRIMAICGVGGFLGGLLVKVILR